MSNEEELLSLRYLITNSTPSLVQDITICFGEFKFAGDTILLVSCSTLLHIFDTASRSVFKTAHIDPLGHCSIKSPLL